MQNRFIYHIKQNIKQMIIVVSTRFMISLLVVKRVCLIMTAMKKEKPIFWIMVMETGYKDAALSRFIMSAKGDLDKRTVSDSVSSANLNEDNLETADIQQLEAQLSVEHQIVHVDYLYQWLKRQCEHKYIWRICATSRTWYGKKYIL